MVWAIVGFIALFAAIVSLSIYLAAKRRKELTEWGLKHGLAFNQANDYEFEAKYPNFSALHQGSNRYAYNLLTGVFKDRSFTGFDYHYETYSTNSKGERQTSNHYFSGVILGSDVPLKPLSIRPEGLFDKLVGFVGFDDINFESAEFSRKFHVSADDRKWAFDVLHARAIEFLLAHEAMTIQFDTHHILVTNSSTFVPDMFEKSANLVCGLLELLPQYVIDQQRSQIR